MYIHANDNWYVSPIRKTMRVVWGTSLCWNAYGLRLRYGSNQLTINVTAYHIVCTIRRDRVKLIKLNKLDPLNEFSHTKEQKIYIARYEFIKICFKIALFIYLSNSWKNLRALSRENQRIHRDFEPLDRAHDTLVVRMDDSICRALIFPTDPHHSRSLSP